ncbi:hypothetical protein DL96DRAFT_1617458 [Flagelloscypha sp. PMI_526]|nr:hypothetical protein DL96DRAFT_1617458 [Flagelloscypha sp. PMI_526]
MDQPKAASRTLDKTDSMLDAEKEVLSAVRITRGFPLLPTDVAQTICEFAAELDKTTAHNLYMTSKDIRGWATPFHFRRVVIRSYESLLLLKTSETLGRIAPYIISVSLQPKVRDRSTADPSRIAEDLSDFLKSLPKLVHFHWPLSPHESMWGQIFIALPRRVTSLEIGCYYLHPPSNEPTSDGVLSESATRARKHITHLYSDLISPLPVSLFTRWTALTHLFFGIRTRNRFDDNIANSTFPFLKAPFYPLPISIVSCIVADPFSSAHHFEWAIDQVFVDLVLDEIDSRIIFAAGESREFWMMNEPGIAPPVVDLSWIRIALDDAIVYHDQKKPLETIWEEADAVRRRRRTAAVRESVYNLLSPRP